MVKIDAFTNKIKEYLNIFSKKSFVGKCDAISFGLLFLFFIDCSFSGGGKYLSFGPISFRMAAAAVAFVFAIPKVISNIKKYIKNPIFYMFFAFLIYLAFSALRGISANNNTTVLISDIKGFMWLFTVPALVVTVDNKKRFDNILNAIVIGAFIQAAIVLVIHFVSCFVDNGIEYFYQPLLDLQIGIINFVSNNVYRIFMSSSPYMIAACGILLFKQISAKQLKLKFILPISLFLCCIILSFTRSLFGCVFVVFASVILAVFVFFRSKIKLMLKTLACVLLSTLLCISMLEFAFDASYFNFAVSRTFGTPVKISSVVVAKYKLKNVFQQYILGSGNSSGTDLPDTPGFDDDEFDDSELLAQEHYLQNTGDSDNLRATTKKELKELILKNPIIGNGLGACSKTRNGPDEYFYYDTLARMGIVGLLLYVAPFIYILIYVLKKKSLLSVNVGVVSLLCGAMGFWAITWFNPWMNAVLGIAIYALSCSIIEILKKDSLKV